MKWSRTWAVIAVALCFSISAWATSLGNDVTIYDGWHGSGGWSGSGDPRYDVFGDRVREDNETEPGTYIGQEWDLEGVYFDSSTGILSLAGGYNFQNGLAYGNGTIDPGDIFIDLTGTGAGWDYVLDISGTSYALYDLTTATGTLVNVTDISSSSPWRWNYGSGTSVGSGTVAYNAYDLSTWSTALGAVSPEHTPVGWQGQLTDASELNAHYVMSGFDLSSLYASLTPGDGMYIHYTYECGNDLLTGYIPTPEPMSAVLLAIGIAGFAVRKRFAGVMKSS